MEIFNKLPMGCRWEVNQYLRSPHPIATEIIEYYEECLNGARDIVTLKELSDYMVDRGEDAIPDGVTFWGISTWFRIYAGWNSMGDYDGLPFSHIVLPPALKEAKEVYYKYYEPLLWIDEGDTDNEDEDA